MEAAGCGQSRSGGGASNVRATQRDADDAGTNGQMCGYQGRMRKHKQTVTHLWLIKPLQRRLRIMR